MTGPPSRPPSVDALARSLADLDLPHPLLVDAARRAVADAPDRAAEVARADAVAVRKALLRRVINASGVLLHTNLGRAPLAVDVPASATNLELDLVTGGRGSRRAHAGALLARACGAEAALVVNNGAAALLLALAALAAGEGVVVGRGDLVEIGGGFRIPEVVTASGARLVEVGTTNRTRTADVEAAVAAGATTVLGVHRSNYRIVGFTETPTTRQLAGVGVPLVVDLGSGLLDEACPWLAGGRPAWLDGEPAVRQTLDDGAALVTFSGDKLLGGPQAGVIAGRADLVERCARHPLYRALRPGGLLLAALQQVALAYLDRTADQLPFWRMATTPVAVLRARAATIAAHPALAASVGANVEVCATASLPGGGTLPGVEIASAGLSVAGDRTAELRRAATPVIARVEDGATLLDLRAVDPADDGLVVEALAALSPAST